MTHVDSHSHIFNAEDLPIDGFIKKLSPVPALLTGVFSVPLDALMAWAAPGSGETEHLLRLLRAASGLETPGATFEDPQSDLLSDDELDRALIRELASGNLEVSAEEAATTADEPVFTQLEALSLDEAAEVESWLREWGDHQFESDLGSPEGQAEGIGDMAKWALSRGRAVRRAAKRYLAALRLITRYRHQIAGELASTYPSVKLFTPALVDFTFTTSDKPSTGVADQIAVHSLVAKLSVIGRIPGAPDVRFHPFVGFCPYREIEASELKRWDVTSGTANRYVPFASRSGPTTPTSIGRISNSIRPERSRSMCRPGSGTKPTWRSATWSAPSTWSATPSSSAVSPGSRSIRLPGSSLSATRLGSERRRVNGSMRHFVRSTPTAWPARYRSSPTPPTVTGSRTGSTTLLRPQAGKQRWPSTPISASASATSATCTASPPTNQGRVRPRSVGRLASST